MQWQIPSKRQHVSVSCSPWVLISSLFVLQGNNGRQRGVLVLDTWQKTTTKPTPRKRPAAAAGSWRSTPYSSVPANSTDDISDASSAVAARSYYSMMNGSSTNGEDSSLSSPTGGMHDPVHSHQADPNVMQLWTDKPRFSSAAAGYSGAQHQQHHDPYRHQQQQPKQPRIYVPPPPSGATTEEYARWQALQSVMAALQHSSGQFPGFVLYCLVVRCTYCASLVLSCTYICHSDAMGEFMDTRTVPACMSCRG